LHLKNREKEKSDSSGMLATLPLPPSLQTCYFYNALGTFAPKIKSLA